MEWVAVFALIGVPCLLTFWLGVMWERGTSEPEPCRRRHADELK